MERLLERALGAADQAEVYSLESRWDSVRYVNGRLHDVDASRTSGVSLRILRDVRTGFAYTRNLRDPDDLVRAAEASLLGGVEAGFDLPLTEGIDPLPTLDPSIREVGAADLLEECRRVHDLLAGATTGEVTTLASASEGRVKLLNSAGTDLASRSSSGVVTAEVVYPGSGSGIARFRVGPRFEPLPERLTDEVVRLFNAGAKAVRPAGGRMKVLFMPASLWTLTWRLMSGTSAKSVHEGISPIAERVGEPVLDEKVTLLDDPRDMDQIGPRPFDDEGVACARRPLIERGVLRGFFADLSYAAKLGIEPTGHGWRVGTWSNDTLANPPTPSLRHIVVEPGEATLEDLVATMDRGIVLEGVLGAHSGNIPNGDYSVGVSPGLWVENGEIVGRVKDAMVSGNVYDTLREVVAVGRDLAPSFGRTPPILCDGVSVSCQ